MSLFAQRLAQGGAVLAPMAGFTDAPYRRLCRAFGSAWAVTEMVSAKALALGSERTAMIGAPYRNEPNLVIQLFAAEPHEAAVAAEILRDRFAPAALDLNMGCPVRKVAHKGCGVQLMQRPERAAAIVRAMREASGLPVSVKMRLGIDKVTVQETADAAVAGGAAAVAVHGRTGVQRYQGEADWSEIAALAARLPVPVIGSGDVVDAASFRARRASGAHVMIGRGALGRPWLFREVRGGRAADWCEAVQVMRTHVRDQAAWYGEERGVRGLRGHLAAYLAAFPGRAGLRSALVRAETVADVDGVLATTVPDAESSGSLVAAASGWRDGNSREGVLHA